MDNRSPNVRNSPNPGLARNEMSGSNFHQGEMRQSSDGQNSFTNRRTNSKLRGVEKQLDDKGKEIFKSLCEENGIKIDI